MHSYVAPNTILLNKINTQQKEIWPDSNHSWQGWHLGSIILEKKNAASKNNEEKQKLINHFKLYVILPVVT